MGCYTPMEKIVVAAAEEGGKGCMEIEYIKVKNSILSVMGYIRELMDESLIKHN